VGERLIPGDRVVHPAERGGEAAAGGGERLESERGQQLRRPGIPRVRDEQRMAGAMEVQETLGEFAHAVSLADLGSPSFTPGSSRATPLVIAATS
jgi:hypothetical protein